jgi:hypothetical protein
MLSDYNAALSAGSVTVTVRTNEDTRGICEEAKVLARLGFDDSPFRFESDRYQCRSLAR